MSNKSKIEEHLESFVGKLVKNISSGQQLFYVPNKINLEKAKKYCILILDEHSFCELPEDIRTAILFKQSKMVNLK